MRVRNASQAETLPISEELEADAGEYVLGTLPDHERNMFEMRLRADPVARQAVARWESSLAPLAGLAQPRAPQPELFQRIEGTIKAQARPAPPSRRRGRILSLLAWLPDRLTWWRSAAAVLALLVLLLGAGLWWRPAQPLPASLDFVAILENGQGQPVWLASTDPLGRTVAVHLLGSDAGGDATPYLWLLPKGDGVPVLLGALDRGRQTVIALEEPVLEQIQFGAEMGISHTPAGTPPPTTPSLPFAVQGAVVPYHP